MISRCIVLWGSSHNTIYLELIMEFRKVRKSKYSVVIGDKYGYLTIISDPFYATKGRADQSVKCQCDCGKEKIVFTRNLVLGNTKSCGCMTSTIRHERSRFGTLASNGMKRCSKCKVNKPISEYSIDNSRVDKLFNRCKTCHRDYSIGFKFGISNEEYNKILVKQQYKCACCQLTLEETKESKQFSIDHCHKTGKIRGLLCNSCNRGIGFLGDNLEGVMNAVKYLQNS